ncbi:MAG TPA: histidine kinase [Kineosporiaceae bacterium]|nr:histidine kinase [Kineosporiaceae bacterium]
MSAGRFPRAPSQLAQYALAALAAAALSVWQGPVTARLLLALAVALAPWGLLLAGVRLPLWVFVVLTLAPVGVTVAFERNDASLFLAVVAVTRVTSQTDRWQFTVPVTAVAALLPLLHAADADGDHGGGAAYFAFGILFGAFAGVLLRRETLLRVELEQAQRQLAATTAAAERRRIARDVHDIVGHSLTVVVLHIAGARRMIRTEPDIAERALLEAEQAGRESLDAVRDVIGLLREDPVQHPGRRGSPGDPASSYDLNGLVDTFRSAGAQVDLTVEGEPAVLPAAAQATMYRFMQEALTNIARHGRGDAPAQLWLRYTPDAVQAEARNQLPAGRPPARGSGGHDLAGHDPAGHDPAGHGLAGMRERIGALGGDLHAAQVGDQWVVSCRLPLTAASLERA